MYIFSHLKQPYILIVAEEDKNSTNLLPALTLFHAFCWIFEDLWCSLRNPISEPEGTHL